MSRASRATTNPRGTAKRTVLATGGAGFIGSHVAAELLKAGYRLVILDNFFNSERNVIRRINSLGQGQVDLVEGDVRDPACLWDLFSRYDIYAVVHLAGLKAVGESVASPLLYYDANIKGAVVLFEAMRRHGVKRLVFSSSATVYGAPEVDPVPESAPRRALNPYGRTKLFIEEMITDIAAADPEFAAISLRYFNPVGAHPSGLLGEAPRGVPNNLFPYVAQVAAGLRSSLKVYGGDYPTKDGTGVRDYIHVMDLARGHRAAIERLDYAGFQGTNTAINLGTGQGYSVLEVVEAFAQACGHSIAHEIVKRRPGDSATCIADPSLAAAKLGWRAEHGLTRMCADHWAFQRNLLMQQVSETAAAA